MMLFRKRASAFAGAIFAPLCAFALAGCSALAGDADPLSDPAAGEWLSDGRTYSAQRYSPLTQIDASNVGELGLAWYDDLDTYRGVEATPLYSDGVLYNILPFNITIAYDAKTGERLWTFDPEVPREMGRYACCEPVSRGLAMWNDKIIIATLDGRLIGLDRKTGEQVWSTRTFDNEKYAYTITGAPRVFDGKVVIGQSGGDFGVRGFVIALDADTGEKLWKFYLAPGNPADGPDGEASDPIMEMIRKTWFGDKYWELGGGANAWDSIAYDPENKLVFVGTGNGSPLSRYHRSENKGDNLFLCSIVALHAETGEYAWHYQMVPGEDWDYTCTSSIVSADLEIDGKQRQVIMQAPKNGFYYVLDRKTGELISAESYVKVNWSSGPDPETGRMIVNPEVRYGTDPVLVYPGPGGAHNWFPMAYSPRTKLAYFPAYQSGRTYALDPDFKAKPFRSNSGWGGYGPHQIDRTLALQKEGDKDEQAFLVAYDPVKQEIAWKVDLPRHGNGGVFVTASDLVFEGTTKQTFAAFDANTGEQLWEFPTQSAPVAGGITYELDGEQYIAINAGWGGGAAQIERGAGIELPRSPARLLVFKLGGSAQLPPLAAQEPVPPPPPLRASEAVVQRGAKLYADTCSQCHGDNAVGGVKDLRHMSAEAHEKFRQIVLEGLYLDKGMASFADLIDEEEADAIHAYLIARANEDWGE
ncbi:quinohemoprotein ethanol dehydrogenase [Altererythrobacter atlanticus]|uniref:Quinohemoprotein alcohol dehydrogenase ADH IIB n=1 Tax=Croceibacterium atlanticum TaxID=1267766 RepID=A0A0F7KY83_9SPHN|nr:PQQ-dependent dehydrogenase, methanol/ethanol family [Croceibacterium atlanticum]AKH44206.1 Quinohemoprotein alcohol dehydrogenase ADH IIB precursor [Croceibacterium atlanticum]MBB5732517.1 quinohemoprotein ethanol dehydrogenase [Croceibacterium atlanticum]